MKNTPTKIDFLSITKEIVTFSGFKLYQVYYTFDVWSPGKIYNEICIRKDELVKLYKSLKSFSQRVPIEGFILQDYDSPSTVEVRIISQEELSLVFKLTYPEIAEFSISLAPENINGIIRDLENVLSLVDDEEYEKKMSSEHGLDFTY